MGKGGSSIGGAREAEALSPPSGSDTITSLFFELTTPLCTGAFFSLSVCAV
jgi:hypothetical protein